MAIPDVLGTVQKIFRIGLSTSVGSSILRFSNSSGNIDLIVNPTESKTIDLLDLDSSTKQRKSISVVTGRNLQLTDTNRFLICINPTAITLTIPTLSWEVDTEIEILQWGIGQVTIAAGSGVTITRLGGTTHTLSGKGAVEMLKLISTNDWLLLGGFN
jgi:hypothetical protein